MFDNILIYFVIIPLVMLALVGLSQNIKHFEGLTYFGDETTYRLGADLYIDPTLSVGVSIADSTSA